MLRPLLSGDGNGAGGGGRSLRDAGDSFHGLSRLIMLASPLFLGCLYTLSYAHVTRLGLAILAVKSSFRFSYYLTISSLVGGALALCLAYLQ